MYIKQLIHIWLIFRSTSLSDNTLIYLFILLFCRLPTGSGTSLAYTVLDNTAPLVQQKTCVQSDITYRWDAQINWDEIPPNATITSESNFKDMFTYFSKSRAKCVIQLSTDWQSSLLHGTSRLNDAFWIPAQRSILHTNAVMLKYCTRNTVYLAPATTTCRSTI